MNPVIYKPMVSIYRNEWFYCITVDSGYSRYARDSTIPSVFLPLDVEDGELGTSIIESLGRSRFLQPDELGDFFDRDLLAQRYEVWVGLLMERAGVKGRRKLFKNMELCFVTQESDQLLFTPMQHEKLEAWSGWPREERQDERLVPPFRPMDVGAATRRAFASA